VHRTCLSPSLLCDDALLMRGRSTACIPLILHESLGILPRLGFWSKDSSGSENKRDTVARQGIGVTSPHCGFHRLATPFIRIVADSSEALTQQRRPETLDSGLFCYSHGKTVDVPNRTPLLLERLHLLLCTFKVWINVECFLQSLSRIIFFIELNSDSCKEVVRSCVI